MSFRNEVRNRLSKLEITVDIMRKLLLAKDDEIKRLVKQNTDLMDRFMAAKWENYINASPDRWDSPRTEVSGDTPLTDLSNIGEILSDEDIRK